VYRVNKNVYTKPLVTAGTFFTCFIPWMDWIQPVLER